MLEHQLLKGHLIDVLLLLRLITTGKANFNTYEGFDRWFQGAFLGYGGSWEDDESPGGHYKAASEFPPHTFKMLRRFFEDYKTLEDKVVEVDEILPPDRAHEVIEDSMRRYSAMRQRGELKGA